MKSICITGSSQNMIGDVELLLQSSGLSSAKHVERDKVIDFAEWHRRVVDMAVDEISELQSIQHPGKMWEQLASELFLTNLDSNLWGWADHRSIWLLDFWATFEPSLYFLLVCSTPERYLVEVIQSNEKIENLDSQMKKWQIEQIIMLNFAHRYNKRAILIDIDDIFSKSEEFIKLCINKWRLPLENNNLINNESSIDSIALYLAEQYCSELIELQSLYAEIDASRIPLLPKVEKSSQKIDHLISKYRLLKDHSKEAELLEETKKELEDAKDEIKRLSDSINNLIKERDEQASISAERQRQIEVLTSEKGLLEQERAELTKRCDALQLEVNALIQARDEHSRLAEERRLQLEQVRNEKAMVVQEMQMKIDSIVKERDEQAELVYNHQKNLDSIRKELEEMKVKTKDIEEENELLLLQLHQVQEELEHYFLMYQDAQKTIKDNDKRWQRILKQYPNYIDYEGLKAKLTDDGNIKWSLKSLFISNRKLENVEFETLIEQDTTGFIFHKDSNLFLRLPTENQNDRVLLLPAGTQDELNKRLEVMIDLSTNDWYCMESLVSLVDSALEKPETIGISDNNRTNAFRQGLLKFREVMNLLNNVFRYDHVELKREQVNPDYEHLWFKFNNISFSHKRWDDFEFRLSCAHVRPKKFGTHPKLEFPEEGARHVLSGWVAESEDDFGTKYELRFALPKDIDIKVWNMVNDDDHLFIGSLILRLPAILKYLEGQGIRLKRQWKDWIDLANNVCAIYKRVVMKEGNE